VHTYLSGISRPLGGFRDCISVGFRVLGRQADDIRQAPDPVLLPGDRPFRGERVREVAKAFVLLSDVRPAAGPLGPVDLEALGEAAVWTDHHDESIDAHQRAHEAYLAAGETVAAARVAIALVPNHIARLHMSAARGWFNKAKRLLDGEPESVTHGELAAMTALIQLASGETEPGLESARVAHRLGQTYDDRDLVALGLVFQGYALARLGRLDDSMAMLDEAMAGAVAGELGPFATAMVYCRTICTCLDLFDFRRATEWTDLVQGITDVAGPVGVAGDCRTHRAAVKIFRGEWAEGEREAERACTQSAAWDLNHTAAAQYELGEIKRRMGDFVAASEAFRRSHELGGSPTPASPCFSSLKATSTARPRRSPARSRAPRTSSSERSCCPRRSTSPSRGATWTSLGWRPSSWTGSPSDTAATPCSPRPRPLAAPSASSRVMPGRRSETSGAAGARGRTSVRRTRPPEPACTWPTRSPRSATACPQRWNWTRHSRRSDVWARGRMPSAPPPCWMS